FFQAEDGIRDFHVTGVQTCALPILIVIVLFSMTACSTDFLNVTPRDRFSDEKVWQDPILAEKFVSDIYNVFEASNSGFTEQMQRSEERRVGKEYRSRSRV